MYQKYMCLDLVEANVELDVLYWWAVCVFRKLFDRSGIRKVWHKVQWKYM